MNKLAFWIISNLAQSPGLIAQVRQDVLLAVQWEKVDETYRAKRFRVPLMGNCEETPCSLLN
jgi:hypothetical protein